MTTYAVKQSRRMLAVRLQRAKEERILREIDSLDRLVESAIRSRSQPPSPRRPPVVEEKKR